MRTITIIGWSASQRAVVESVSYWPDEMELYLAIAKSAAVTNLMTIESVLVEEGEERLSIAEAWEEVRKTARRLS